MNGILERIENQLSSVHERLDSIERFITSQRSTSAELTEAVAETKAVAAAVTEAAAPLVPGHTADAKPVAVVAAPGDVESGLVQVGNSENAVSTANVATPVAAAPTQETADRELDSKGNWWDERIHSDNKSKKNDGTFKLRRGHDKELAKKILAEQLAGGQTAEPAPVSAPAEPAAVTSPEPVVSAPATQVAPPPAQPVVAAPPVAQPVPVAAPVEAEKDYKKLAIIVTNNITQRGVEFGAFTDVFTSLGATSFEDLAVDKYEQFHTLVDDWDCDLQEVEQCRDDLAKYGQQATDGFNTYVSHYGVAEYFNVARDQLKALLSMLTDYLGQWKAAQPGV